VTKRRRTNGIANVSVRHPVAFIPYSGFQIILLLHIYYIDNDNMLRPY
jgi:hypothetical protein